MKLTKLVQTTGACPSQWDAEDEDCNYVYIRYRHGFLYVSTAPSEEEWAEKHVIVFEKTVSEEDDGVMSTVEMLEHTGLEFIGELQPDIEVDVGVDSLIDFLEDLKRHREQ